jgi:hypothetical protein
MSTEWSLENWRQGQTSSERMCLQLLLLEGFEELDPQCPLGGRDGRKDIRCSKNNWKYVAAAFFPAEKAERFSELKEKFSHDLEGVGRNGADGIVFLTGQKLTPAERTELIDIAEKSGAKALIYHQERIRGLLDSPMGFAVRLEYLEIPMRPEEQIAFVLAIRSTHNRELQDMINRVEWKLDQLLNSSAAASALQLKAINVLATLSTIARPFDLSCPPSGTSPPRTLPLDAVPENLTHQLICELHGALMFERPGAPLAGAYRTFDVWIGGPGASKEEAAYVPPKFAAVPAMMDDLLTRWNGNLSALTLAADELKFDAITAFHFDFLRIHPFADGNGTLSRYLVQAQAQRLNLTGRAVVIRERAAYAKAIEAAHGGTLKPLRDIIHQAITGVDTER